MVWLTLGDPRRNVKEEGTPGMENHLKGKGRRTRAVGRGKHPKWQVPPPIMIQKRAYLGKNPHGGRAKSVDTVKRVGYGK